MIPIPVPDIAELIGLLRKARAPDRGLDVSLWFYLGFDYEGDGSWARGSPIGPANQVNGHDMRQALAKGYLMVERAYDVPLLTEDIGAAYTLLDKWLPTSSLDLRTGGGECFHRACVTDEGVAHVGLSLATGACAVCAALLAAFAAKPRSIRPGMFASPDFKSSITRPD